MATAKVRMNLLADECLTTGTCVFVLSSICLTLGIGLESELGRDQRRLLCRRR